MRKLTLLVAYLWCVGILFAQSPMKIGDEIAANVSTGHPYNVSGTKGFIFEETFHNDNSSYIKLHFKNFQLQPGDYVEVFSPNTGESHIYAEGGKVVDFETRETISEFWSNIIWDETVTVRLYSNSSSSSYGFDIDVAAYGYSEKELERLINQRTVCGSDDKEEAICYNGTEMYNKAQAVCRIIVNGSILCTGWLVGSQGHVMTNNHCIESSSAAQNTDFQFNYQYTNCNGSSAASTDVVASTSTLIKTNQSLDYTLVQLPVNPTGTYGYLSMASQLTSAGTRIYIPQHPGGARKKLAVNDDQASDGIARINSVGSSRISYFADTEGGSSGSPVLDYNSNLVVVLHNTGSCTSGNGGNRIPNIISDLGNLVPANGVDNSTGGGGQCTGIDVPTASTSKTDETSSGANNGTITFSFQDDASGGGTRTNLEFSLDGGNSYPVNVPDNSGSYTFTSLSPGTYNLWIRWGNDQCARSLGSLTINAAGGGGGGGSDCQGSCPDSHPLFLCDRCWEDYAQAQSGGCFDTCESLVEDILFENESLITTDVLSVYPVPATAILNIKGLSQGAYYEIFDQSGKLILSNNSIQLDVSNARPGMYYLKSGEKTIRFVIE